ncbi:metallophosphoesterase [Pseudomonas sp. SWRI100]|uniref:metallophosphoesterase n=1 Tax=Pseudomonas TaxID=286 RepID=UPI0016443D54|nr:MULTISPECIES: metallophosphoesterase [Pseudomonas]MBC3495748.1 metallophosphoesterase [Pseudomonas sp. SWRI67]MBV4526857.1 metallophosphoesterase [Pseudomonas kermanshahensis]
MNSKVLQLPKNLHGRDFVVGDIHFKTTDLHRGLHALGFDKAKDRLIAVGDVIDRGPGVLDGLKLLGEPWFFSVQGNHERMLIDAYGANPEARYSAHGAGWWMTIADESKAMIIEKLRSLPVAIEVASNRGVVGVVHADVPAGMAWPTFLEQLDNPAMEEIALWGRDRIVKHHREGVPGVWRVCTGHTWIPRPLRLGNVLALDVTGGADGSLAIYSIQEDKIFIDGVATSIDQAESLSEQLQQLEQRAVALKTTVNSNKLIETQVLAAELETVVKLVNSMWQDVREGVEEQQRLVNALHGLSLATGERRGAKLDELCARYENTQVEGLLRRLLG